ncbi:MAG TPA: crossover junction endodeoxyribonuclease RuvC [Acidimicrobiia bacterium]|nr:crossover junction endodeoxyribonuclease RuvC [Acidimicrobiia bacterium]
MFDRGVTSGVVLGIDPGVSRCGYGAVAREGSRLTAVACGVIRTAPGEPLPTRLAALAAELELLVAETRPVAVAVERVLFQVNARTAMSVGQASGLALTAAGRAGIPVVHYSPNEVKLAVAGDGGAGKEEVQQMVARLLGLRDVPRPADAADALALAICHWWRAPLHAAIADGPSEGSKLEAAIAAALEHDKEGAR